MSRMDTNTSASHRGAGLTSTATESRRVLRSRRDVRAHLDLSTPSAAAQQVNICHNNQERGPKPPICRQELLLLLQDLDECQRNCPGRHVTRGQGPPLVRGQGQSSSTFRNIWAQFLLGASEDLSGGPAGRPEPDKRTSGLQQKRTVVTDRLADKATSRREHQRTRLEVKMWQ